jgi:hypothetical protein
MAVTLEALVGTSVYNLSSFDTYIHLANDGLGLPDLTRYYQSGPLQNGASNTGYRLEPRDIILTLGMVSDDEIDYFAKRKTLMNIFKPKDIPIKLRLTLPDGSQRQIDTYYQKGLNANSADKTVYYHRFAVALKAPDPTWYDPNGYNVAFGVVSASGFTVPMSVPTSVGRSTIGQTVSIDYTGSWDSYPIITVVGPVTNLVITNDTTGDVLDFTGYTINAGTTVTIDTRYGFKSVISDAGTNLIDKLTTASDLASFRLVAAEDDSPSFTNDVSVTGSNATDATRIFVSYFNRYIAI